MDNSTLRVRLGSALVALLFVCGCSEESSPTDHGRDGDIGIDVDGEIGEVGSDETSGEGPREDAAVEVPDIDDGGAEETDVPPPADEAGVVGVSIPDSIVCNTTASASITMRNDGSATWTSDVYALGMVGDADPFLATGDGPRVALPGGTPVPPGGTVTFELTLHAPRTAGMYATDYQMVHEGEAWFGAIVARDVEVTGSCTDPVGEDNAEVAEIHYPTTLHCWDAQHVSITVRNTGTSTWTTPAGYRLGVPSGDNVLTPSGSARYLMGERASIAPGQTYTFWFTAFHETPGDFAVDFQMVREGVAWFPAAPLATVSISVIEPCDPSSPTSSMPPSLYLDATGGVNWAINGLVVDYPPDVSILFAEGTGAAGNGCTGTYYLFDTMMFSYGVAQRINDGPLGAIATVDPFAGDELTVKTSEVSSESFDIIANPATGANCVRRAYLGTWTPAWP